MNTDIATLEDSVAQHVRAAAKKRGGSITPEQLVEDASRARHPLHNYFEWDDADAGRRFRLMQARVIISSVTLRLPTEGGGVRLIREFVVVKDGSSSKFVSAKVIQTKTEHKTNILQQVHVALVSIKKRYGSVIDVFGDEIDATIAKVAAAIAVSKTAKKKAAKKTAKKSGRRAAA